MGWGETEIRVSSTVGGGRQDPGAGKTPAVGEAMGSEPQASGHRGVAQVTSREKESRRRLLGGEC